MIDIFTSPISFAILLSLFGGGMITALICHKNNKAANLCGNVFAIAGSLWGILLSISIFTTGNNLRMQAVISSFSQFSFALHVDKLAAFFIFIICLITLFCSIYGIGYVKSYYNKYNIGALGFFYNAFIIGMLLVVTAANGILFLTAWEIMSLASYFLVIYDRNDHKNIKAGYLYLVMTHLGAACLMLAFILLFKYTGSFDFSVIQSNIGTLSPIIKTSVFGLFLIGLGVKAGVIPMHIWLPSAHPAAPSHVSALMSGVMIKTGIYLMIRMFMYILQPIPEWWGVVVLIVGAISAVLGVLYALTEHDIKRLLAYHSIENIGIILLGLGSAMIFSSINQNGLALAALVASLFHTLNHATFKSLLFMSAGSVIHATKTRNIEKYGGLIKLMPITACCFLIGSMAISAMPPLNGFFSEWITFQSLFNGIWTSGTYATWAFLLATAALALTSGLALACFVKAFGITFLARPRSVAAKKAKESSRLMQVGMIGMAGVCVIIGLCAAPVVVLLKETAQQAMGLNVASSVGASQLHTITFNSGTTSVSGPITAVLLLIAGLAVWLAVRYGVNRKQKVSTADTWDCGTPLTSRMEITATGFSRSIILIFRGILRPSLQNDIEYDDAASRYTPKSRTVSTQIRDTYQDLIYRPVYDGLIRVSRWIKTIQNGNLNVYILYVFAALIIVLVMGV